jgi:hypothetical protein
MVLVAEEMTTTTSAAIAAAIAVHKPLIGCTRSAMMHRRTRVTLVLVEDALDDGEEVRYVNIYILVQHIMLYLHGHGR